MTIAPARSSTEGPASTTRAEKRARSGFLQRPIYSFLQARREVLGDVLEPADHYADTKPGS